MSERRPIAIAGGGLAGLSAALFLARDGHQVTVYERQRGPIDRVCGEGMLPFGVALLAELGLRDQAIAAGMPFHGVRYVCQDQVAEGRFPSGQHGLGIARAQLDRLLRERAQQVGVMLREGEPLEPGTIGESCILAADGIHSGWARIAGHRTRASRRLGLRFRLETAPPQRVEVHFFAGFEIYLTPVARDGLSVAFLLDPDRLALPGAQLRAFCLEHFASAFPHLADLSPRDLAMRGPIAARPGSATPSLHLLGDAAQAFDPISGAGMSFALTCAHLASRHLDSPSDYWRALAPHRRALGTMTRLVLALRGGGWRTRLMVRQLGRAGDAFDRMLALHDGRSAPWALGARNALALLRP